MSSSPEKAADHEQHTAIQQVASVEPQLPKSEDVAHETVVEKGGSTEQSSTSDAHDDLEPDYPSGPKLALLTAGVLCTVFLVSLDFSILATAIPAITAEFQSLEDVGWYGSSYLLTAASPALLMGKFYSVFNLKIVFLVALFLFELGSVVAAAAPSSTALIIGRAIAGLGNAGLLSGATLILTHSVPLKRRSMFIGFNGGVYGIAAIAGPPLGGAFTDRLTWRWCFWINLPVGAVTLIAVLLCFKSPKAAGFPPGLSLWQKILRFDPLGTILFMPAIICILLALQWGGSVYPWNNGRIIALFVIFGVCIILFVFVQKYMQENATIPPRIFLKRTIWSSTLYQFMIGAGFFVFTYYLPIWFQAVQGVSAIESGVRNLPMLVGQILATTAAGVIVPVVGYFAPFMILGTVLSSIAAGLLTTLDVDSSSGAWIGYQALLGLGIGFGWTQPLVAVQTAVELKDAAIATATVALALNLGGSLFVSVAQTAFSAKLLQELAVNVPGLDPSIVTDAGASGLASKIPGEFLSGVIQSYNNAVVNDFVVATVMLCLSVIGCAAVKWNSVKGHNIEMGAAA